jgi:hypothetical protein
MELKDILKFQLFFKVLDKRYLFKALDKNVIKN